jgi:hypothetical protein
VKLPQYPRDGSEPADLRRRRAILRALRWAAVAAAMGIGIGVVVSTPRPQSPRETRSGFFQAPL